MDAISFVLGIKSNQLRSAQIKELIYHDGKEVLDTCSVGLVYQDEDMTTVFSRRYLFTDKAYLDLLVNTRLMGARLPFQSTWLSWKNIMF
jgi:chromosome segregation ATPase